MPAIELRNIKHAVFASEETPCFEATIYMDGVRLGTVSNGGKGGCNDYWPNSIAKTLDDIGATLPLVDISFGDEKPVMVIQDADWIIGDLLHRWLLAKDLKKALKSRFLCVRDEKLMQTPKLSKEKIAQGFRNPDEIRRLMRSGVVLNFLPEEEALALYKKHG